MMPPAAAGPPIVLLTIVSVALGVVLARMPRKPTVVPVPWIVIAPMLLFEMLPELKLKSWMPMIGALAARVELSLRTIVEEPSRLPIVLPVRLPTSKMPEVVPSAIAIKGELEDREEARLLVWLIPEIRLPWTLVAVLLLAPAKSKPRTSLEDPAMMVMPVPPADPKPITLPIMEWKLPLAPVLPTRVMPE